MSGKPIPEGVVHAFVDWLAKEMPPGTYISSPQWWASRIIRQIEFLTAAQQQGQTAAFDIDRARTLIDYVVDYARATELNSLSSDACVALSDLHTMLHAPQPTQQGGGEVVWVEVSEKGAVSMGLIAGVKLLPGRYEFGTAPPSAPVGVDGLAGLLEQIRDLLASLPVDCLGTDTAADGQPYPIRDEVIHSITKALAQQPAAGSVGDTRRMDWLEQQAVEVRKPLRYGSTALFHAEQVSDDDEPHRTDLRAQIDSALATQHQEPK